MAELPDLTKRIGPAGNGTDSENTWRRSETDSIATKPVDLVNATPKIRDAFWQGFTSGYCAGHEAGREFAEDEISALQREAARVVHGLARISERDREVDKARRARIEARWSA